MVDFPGFEAHAVDLPDAAEMPPHADAGERLCCAEIRFCDEMKGPESVAFDPRGRVPYTGVADGQVLVWDGVRKQGEGDLRRDAEAAADLPSSPIPVLLLRRFPQPPAAAPPPPPHPCRGVPAVPLYLPSAHFVERLARAHSVGRIESGVLSCLAPLVSMRSCHS